MPSTMSSLLTAAGLVPGGTVPWGQSVPLGSPGVYIVALTANPRSRSGGLPVCPISLAATQALLASCPRLTLDGCAPTPQEVARRIAAFWLPDEVVLYIGMSDSPVRTRVRHFYRTPLGAARPHKGGWFLKTLANLSELHVHFVEAAKPRVAEDAMLAHFLSHVSAASRRGLHDSRLALPFANLELDKGARKNHGVRYATSAGPRPKGTLVKAGAPSRADHADANLVTPSVLAARLRRSPKTVRERLREMYPEHETHSPWLLTPEMVQAVVESFRRRAR